MAKNHNAILAEDAQTWNILAVVASGLTAKSAAYKTNYEAVKGA